MCVERGVALFLCRSVTSFGHPPTRLINFKPHIVYLAAFTGHSRCRAQSITAHNWKLYLELCRPEAEPIIQVEVTGRNQRASQVVVGLVAPQWCSFITTGRPADITYVFVFDLVEQMAQRSLRREPAG